MFARALGIDVSQFQGTVNWSQVASTGKEFAFVRATIGGSTDTGNVDTKLTTNMPAAESAGLLVAPYHHAKPDSSTNDAVNEADWFVQNAGTYMQGGFLRPVLVVEEGIALGKPALSQWVNTFCSTISSAMGVDPIVYANSDFATNYLDTSVASAHDLWLARYNTGTIDPQTDQPQTPSGFNNPYGSWNNPLGSTTPSNEVWDFWQYSNTGSVTGITGNVDLDAFQGERAMLESNFLIAPPGKFQAAINFGKYETNAPSGYINFGDQLYGNILGYTMGWNTTGVVLTTRTGGTAPDQRYRTYASPNATPASRTFEVGVPNGSYRVRLVAGSPDEVGATHKFWVEGTSLISGVNTSTNPFISGVATVTVTDGKITITSDRATAPNSRLMFADIVDAGRTTAPPAAPSNVTATPASSTAIDVRWVDMGDNEGRDPATFSSSTWGQVNEGYRIERSTFSGGSWGSWSTLGYARANAELYQDATAAASTQYQYRVSAVNAAGSSGTVSSNAVTTPSSNSQQAYNATGTAWSTGVTIQAEDFDRGGEGVAFHDTSTGNAGGFYRESGLDVGRIGATSTGAPLSPREHRIDYFRPGEWVAYTVNIPSTGTYAMDFRVSVPGTGAKFHASTIVGATETNLAAGSPGGQWDVPNTSDWETFTTVRKVVPLTGGVQIIRIYADVKASTNPGVMDFDWLRISQIADLVVDGVDEAHETSDGRYLRINANADEGNTDTRGVPLLDNEPDAKLGDRIIGSDADLRNASIILDGTSGTWKLDFPAKIRVWKESSPGNGDWKPVVNGVQSSQVTTAQVIALKIEGIEASVGVNDIDLKLTFTPTSGSTMEDTVKLTVAGADLDVDGDNNNLYGLPNGSRQEEKLEDDASAPGKIIYVNDNDNDSDGIADNIDGYDLNSTPDADDLNGNEKFVPIVFNLNGPFDRSAATYNISYTASDPITGVSSGVPAAGLRLWMKRGNVARNGAGVSAGGDYLAPGQYLGSVLGLTSGSGGLTLWLEAANMPASTRQQITITVDPDGAAGPSDAVLQDSVAVTVRPSSDEGAVISGYKWDDVNGDGIRNSTSIQGNPPRMIFVIDVSSSTRTKLSSFESIGDINGDGFEDTVLDAEIAAFKELNDYLQGQTYNGGTPTVSVIVFAGQAVALDLDDASGTQLSAPVSSDIDDLLSQIGVGYGGAGDGTNYVAALDKVTSVINTLRLPAEETNIVFLSDGYPNPDNYEQYGPRAKTLGVERAIFAFGAGSGAKEDALRIVASDLGGEDLFYTSDGLIQYFQNGLVGSSIEGPVSGVRIYVDLDNDGVFDSGTDEEKYSAITDAHGNYAIIGLPAGTYHVREVVPADWIGTFPSGGDRTVTLTSGQVANDVHFGNQFQGSVDLDIDSDNSGGFFDPPDRNDTEEALEDNPTADGKRIIINDDDTDGDLVKDFADLNISGDHFTPMVLDLSHLSDISNANLTFAYDGSNPSDATSSAPGEGTLRIWLKDADDARSVTDYIEAGRTYLPSELGLSNTNRIITLYVEGIAIAATDAQRLVQVNVVADATAGTRKVVSDKIYVTPQEIADTGKVSGKVFNDTDMDGTRDAGETDAPNIRVYVDLDRDSHYTLNVDPTDVSDSGGNYEISAVPDGNWTVRLADPALHVTAPAAGFRNISVANGQGASSQDFGVAHLTGDVIIEQAPQGSINEGSPVQFTARVTNPTKVTYTWTWSIFRNGVVSLDGRETLDAATISIMKFSPQDDGDYSVTAVASSNGVEIGRATELLTVLNLPPEAEMRISPGYTMGPDTGGPAHTVLASLYPPGTNDPGINDRATILKVWKVYLDDVLLEDSIISGQGSEQISFSAASVGTYIVKCELNDQDPGGTATITSDPILRTNSATSVTGRVTYDGFETGSEEPNSAISLPGYRVYYDANDNEAWDSNEFSGVTDSSGVYEINGLPAASLELTLDVPQEWVSTPSSENGKLSVDLASDPSQEDQDFRIHPALAFASAPSLDFPFNPYAYRLSPITGSPWKPGDVVYYDANEQDLYIVHRGNVDANGNLASGAIEKLPGTVQGNIAFDGNGNILAATYSAHQVNQLSANGLKFDLFTSSVRFPEDLAVDKAGNIYVSGNAGSGIQDPADSRRSGIYKFDKDGSLVAWLAQGVRVDEFALAPDQHSIVFDQGGNLPGNVFRLDTNTGEITNIGKYEVVGGFQGLQIIGTSTNPSDWRIALVTPGDPFTSGTAGSFYLLDWSGKLLQQFETTGLDLALDNTPGYLWISNGGLSLFDWRTGQRVKSFSVTGAATGLSVYSPQISDGQVDSVYTYNARAIQPGIEDTPIGKSVRELYPLRYSLEESPSGSDARIDPLTGVMTWTPKAIGSYDFQIKVVEIGPDLNPLSSSRASATKSFTVAVGSSGANDAPLISDQRLPDGRVGIHYSGLVTASDADRDQLAYSVVGSSVAKIEPYSGLLTFSPTAEGDQTFVVKVEDGRGGVSQANVTVHVFGSILPTNNPPTITGVNDTYTVAAGSIFTISSIALDDSDLADIYQITLSATTKPKGLVVSQTPNFSTEIPSATGAVTWRPKLSDAGSAFNVVLQLSDGRGGIATKSFTISVTDGAPAIADVRVSPGRDPERQRTLNVLTYDAETLRDATFTWSIVDSHGAANPVISDELTGPSMDVTFLQSGSYDLLLTAKYTPEGGAEQTSTKSFTITVDPIIKRVVPILRSIVVPAGTTVNWLSARAFDQFSREAVGGGLEMRWSHTTSDTSVSINSTTGAYTVASGVEASTDTITVSAGTVDGSSVFHPAASADINVALASSATALTGVQSADSRAVEGQLGAFVWSSTLDNSLGTIVDPTESVIDPNNYSVQIDWGDGTSSIGGLSPFNSNGLIPAGQPSGYAFITGSHRYGLQGAYNVTIDITDLRDASRELSLPMQGQGTPVMTVESAPLIVSVSAARPVNGREFNGLIAQFTDPAPVTDAGLFRAVIHWADGTLTRADDPLNEYEIVTKAQGEYAIVARHTYHGVGPVPAYIDLLERASATSWVTVASKSLDIVVGASDLTVPGTPTLEKLAPNVIRVHFTHNRDTEGFVLTRIQYSGGVEVSRTTLPGPTTFTQSEPYTDTGLTPSTQYAYTVTAVDRYLNASSPSPVSLLATTDAMPTITPPAVQGRHTIVTDPQTNSRQEGIQLSWTPTVSTGYGYRIERKSGTGGTYASIMKPGDYLDPADAIGGKLQFFDDFGSAKPFADGTGNYVYRVYTIDINGNVLSGGATEITVAPDSSTPSTPTELRAASYPQAIQLSWDDRPSNEDDIFAGWNVYRRVAATGSFTRLTTDPVFEETGYDDSTAEAGIKYDYEVKAVNVFGIESAAATVTHKRSTNGEPPPPTGLVAMPAGSGDIRISWNTVEPTIDQGHAFDALKGYRVYSSTSANFEIGDSTFRQQFDRADDQAALPVTTYLDTQGLAQPIYYAVTAIDFDGDESWPARVVGKPGDGVLPGSPSGLRASTPTATSTTIQWDAASGTIAGYIVLRRKGSSGAFTAASGPSPIGALMLLEEALSPGSTYEYQVVAVDSDGDLSAPATIQGSTTETTLSVTTDAVSEQRPLVAITSPGASGNQPLLITSDQNVLGYVDDLNDNLQQWRLVLRPANAQDALSDVVVALGTQEVGRQSQPASIGKLRPALIADGLYHLILIAADPGGESSTSTTALQVQIKSEVKAGMFTLPVVDLQVNDVNGQSITVTRIYDSQQSNEKGEFGYGWRLQLDDTHYHTTAQTIDGEPSNSTKRTLRFGDLVYVTIPGQGQHVFAFTPRPAGYDPLKVGDPMNLIYAGASYAPQFVAVDGSNAILTVPREAGYDGDPFFLRRVGSSLKQFQFVSASGKISDYNPANSDVGSELRVQEPDGTKYFINAATGQLKYSVNSLGKISYADDHANNGELRLDIHRFESGALKGLIESVRVVNSAGEQLGADVYYGYDTTNLNLTSVTGRDGKTTGYQYALESRPHHLTSVTDPRGVEAIKASYSPTTGQLEAATDALGNQASLGTGSFNGASLRSSVTDLAAAKGQDGQVTQLVQDNHGNVIREIRKIKVAGEVVKVIVTVHEYIYGSGTDIQEMMQYGTSDANALIESRDYDPIELIGDASIQQIDSARGKLRQVASYYTFSPTSAIENALDRQYVRNAFDPNMRQLASTTTFDDTGRARTTTYEKYKLGRPQKVTDPDGVVTYSKYSDEGLLLWTANAIGEGTQFVHLSATADSLTGDPGGLVSNTYQIKVDTPEQALTASVDTAFIHRIGSVGNVDHPLQTNEYYDDTAPVGSRWRLKSTLDAAGVKRVFAYDAAGNQVLSAKLYLTPVNGQPWLAAMAWGNKATWVANIVEYDSANRVVATEEAVYEHDFMDLDPLNFHFHLQSDPNGMSHVVVDEEFAQLGGVAKTRTLSTATYDSLGKVFQTTDEFDGVTENHYDDRGNLVETLSPDGTKTVSAYDVMGRVIASVDRFKPGQSDPVMVTLSVYDGQGRVSQTQRVSVAASSITVSQDPVNGEVYRVTALGITGLARVTNSTAGSTASQPAWWSLDPDATDPISTTFTYYDEKGRVIETENADHLRTGTIYDGLGLVAYTGPLDEIAPQGAEGRYPRQFETSDFVSYSRTQYDVVNVDTIRVAGNLAQGDHITVAFHNIDHDRENQFSITYDGNTLSLLNQIAGEIEEGNDVQSDPLYGTVVDFNIVGNELQISWNANAVVICEVSTDSVAGAIYTTASRHSTLMRDPLGHWTTSTSDIAGRSDRTIFDDGTSTKTEYTLRTSSDDTLGVPLRDESTQPWGISLAELNQFNVVRREVKIDQEGIATTYLYDLSGRLVYVLQPDPDDLPTGNGPQHIPVWRYRYDLNGNLAEIASPRAIIEGNFSRRYDNGLHERNQYDEFGRMTQQERFNDGATLRSNWFYDIRGRVTTQTDPLGNETRYTHDNGAEHGGRLDQENRYDASDLTYARETTTYTYDDLGRQQTVRDQRDDDNDDVYETGETDELTSYGYDPITGGMIFVATPEGIVHHTYDPATGRLTSTWTDVASSTPATQDISDAITRTDYGYDDRGRLDTVTLLRRDGSDVTADNVTQYFYDEAGNTTSVETAKSTGSSDENYARTTYQYDDLNRLKEMVVAHVNTEDGEAVTPSFQQHYELAVDGQRDNVSELRFAADGAPFSTTNIQWTYDNLNRLIKEQYDEDFADTDNYDSDAPDYTDTYTLDEQGNRLVKEHDADDALNDRTEEYTYRAGIEQLASVTIKDASDTQIEAIGYTYDENGAQTESHHTAGFTNIEDVKYAYDLCGRVISSEVTKGSDPTTYHAFTYGADGRRVKDIERDGPDTTDDVLHVTTRVMDDSNPTGHSQVLEEREGDTEEDTSSATPTIYIIGADIVGQWTHDSGSAVEYLLNDGHGSVRGVTNDNGVVETDEVYNYDAFGSALVFSPDEARSTLLYAGERWDISVVGYDNRARVLNPRSGTFNRIDSFNDPRSQHKYLFINGDPVNGTDPSGMFELTEHNLAVGLMLFFAGSFLTGLHLAFVRNTSIWSTPKSQFLPINERLLVGMRHSVKIRGSKLSPDQMFSRMTRFSELNLFPVKGIGDVSGVGGDVSFDMLDYSNDRGSLLGNAREFGQGDFGVRVTQYSPSERYFVVRTLGGHPLAGWRRWQVNQLPNGDLTIETFSVEHPATYVDSIKMYQLRAQRDMAKTWESMLWDLAKQSNGTVIYDADTVLGGKDFNQGQVLQHKPLVQGGLGE